MGVDGILSVTPYYNKPTQEGLYQHYKAIATAVPLPMVVYSVQGRTGVNVEPATLKRLAEIENIVGVKEASGNISQMARGGARGSGGVHGAVRRRFDRASADRAGRARSYFGGVERNSGGDDEAGASSLWPAISRARARAAQMAAADGSEFRRIESDSGEGRDGDDGTAGAGVALADVRRRQPQNAAKIEAVLEVLRACLRTRGARMQS